MIEIKVPPTPVGLPEEHVGFRVNFVHWIDHEPWFDRLSRQCLAMRVIDAIEASKETGVVMLSDDDHKQICELFEQSELPFIQPLTGIDERTKETKPVKLPPVIERQYVRAIVGAKPAELAQAAE